MSKALLRGIQEFQAAVEAHVSDLRNIRLLRIKEGERTPTAGDLRSYTFSADTALLLHGLRDAAQRDISIYRPIVEFGLPEEPAPSASAAPTAPPSLPESGFVRHIAASLFPTLASPATPDAPLPPASAHFLGLLQGELNDMSNATSLTGHAGGAFVPKLKSALAAFQTQRYGDVQTILKSALRNEPHNNTLLFLLSQLLYFLVSNGHKDALPEAREIAQKCMNYNEKIPPEKLAFYSYHAVTAELLHDPARALNWMRDHGMLHVAPMKSEAGILAQGGLILRAWALAASIDVAHWTEAEFQELKDLALNVVGGGFVYMGLLRTHFITAAMSRKEPFPFVEAIERALLEAYGNYHQISPTLAAMAEAPPAMPWLVQERYLTVLLSVAPRPMFDHILLHISLDGEHWAHGYPDTALRTALADPHASYWRLWSLSLCPGDDIQHGKPFDCDTALRERPLLLLGGELLNLLQAAENDLINPAIFNEVRPWLIRWQMDHFLAAGTGESHPREALMPRAPMLRALYRKWSQPQATGLLGSEVIHATAQHGVFGSPQEILASFEGAYRLLDDPNHGLVATQKRALQLAKQQDPSRFSSMNMGDASGAVGQMLMYLLPLAVLGGAIFIVMTSKNMGQAVGLLLALVGFAGVALLSMGKKS